MEASEVDAMEWVCRGECVTRLIAYNRLVCDGELAQVGEK
jgi:hypothetical protein